MTYDGNDSAAFMHRAAEGRRMRRIGGIRRRCIRKSVDSKGDRHKTEQ